MKKEETSPGQGLGRDTLLRLLILSPCPLTNEETLKLKTRELWDLYHKYVKKKQ